MESDAPERGATPEPAAPEAAGPEAVEPPTARPGSGVDPSRSPEETERDHALIRRAQAGDEDAFGELVARHERRAWRVARNLVPSGEDASDLVQDAFLRVFRSIERFDFKHEFPTWLYRIVTNLAIDHLRKRRPAMSMAGDDEEPDIDVVDESAESPSRRLERGETAVLVRECIDALAPHFQTVLVLRELEGLPCTEIAEIVGATHVTVRWRLHRGRKLFQDEWERRMRLAEAGVGPDGSPHAAPESVSGENGPNAGADPPYGDPRNEP